MIKLIYNRKKLKMVEMTNNDLLQIKDCINNKTCRADQDNKIKALYPDLYWDEIYKVSKAVETNRNILIITN